MMSPKHFTPRLWLALLVTGALLVLIPKLSAADPFPGLRDGVEGAMESVKYPERLSEKSHYSAVAAAVSEYLIRNQQHCRWSVLVFGSYTGVAQGITFYRQGDGLGVWTTCDLGQRAPPDNCVASGGSVRYTLTPAFREPTAILMFTARTEPSIADRGSRPGAATRYFNSVNFKVQSCINRLESVAKSKRRDEAGAVTTLSQVVSCVASEYDQQPQLQKPRGLALTAVEEVGNVSPGGHIISSPGELSWVKTSNNGVVSAPEVRITILPPAALI